MLDFLLPYYSWVKAFHIISVISWMAAMFYLPRLFVYHAEMKSENVQMEETFVTMERRLLKAIMTPAMIASWVFGLLMIGMGGFDFGSVWSWVKLLAVIGMTGMHGWLAARQKEFAAGLNTRSGRIYRIMNEVPTVLMFVIVIFVVVRPY